MKYLIILITATLISSGCGNIFEHNSDVQARNALKKLMKAQDQFFKDNETYARHISAIEDAKKYDLEYHKGVVYMEIEGIYEKGYRAIALPAESITARVFAFDTKQGGYYEMNKSEVSRYVLGALKYVRKEQRYKNMTDLSSIILSTILIIFGAKSFFKYREKKENVVYFSFFVSIFPLSWSLGILNHVNKDTNFSWLVHFGVFGSFVIAILCLLYCIFSFKKIFQNPDIATITGLYTSILIISVFSIIVMGHAFVTYY